LSAVGIVICNLENLSDSQHANYLHHWCLYDIDVVVYLTLTTVSMTPVLVH